MDVFAPYIKKIKARADVASSDTRRIIKHFFRSNPNLEPMSKKYLLMIFFDFCKEDLGIEEFNKEVIECFYVSRSAFFQYHNEYIRKGKPEEPPSKGAPKKFPAKYYPELTIWVARKIEKGSPPTRSEVINKAVKILHANGKNVDLSCGWISSFLDDPLSPLKKAKAYPLEEERYEVNYQTALDWMRFLLEYKANEIDPSILINVDETGFGSSTAKKYPTKDVIVTATAPNSITYQVPRADGHYSAVCSITASGKVLKSYIIHNTKTLPHDSLYTTFYDKIEYCYTKSAFISTAIFEHYISNVVIPYIKEMRKTLPENRQRAGIIMDGHRTHESELLQAVCGDENIALLEMPPHSSHLLQPLDRAFFGRVKSFYRSMRARKELSTVSGTIEKIFNAIESASTISIVLSSWSNAGIVPQLNSGSIPEVILDINRIVNIEQSTLRPIPDEENSVPMPKNASQKGGRIGNKNQKWGCLNEEQLKLVEEHKCPLCGKPKDQ